MQGINLNAKTMLSATMLSAHTMHKHHKQSLCLQCHFAARITHQICRETGRSFSVGIVGSGKMGRCIGQYLIENGLPPSKLVIVRRQMTGQAAPTESSYRNTLQYVSEFLPLKFSRIIYLCVLPSQLMKVAAKLKEVLNHDQLVVSIVAATFMS